MPITIEEIAQDPFTLKIVRRHVDQLITQGAFEKHERDALQQDLLTHIVRKWPNFDERTGHYKPFVCTLVQRYTAKLARIHRASKRRNPGITSLNVLVNDPFDGPIEFCQTLGEADLDRKLGRAPRLTHTERVELANDLAHIIATLPPQQQQLLELSKTMSLSDIARELKIPRSTLQDWLNSIRIQFEKAGLQKYLQE